MVTNITVAKSKLKNYDDLEGGQFIVCVGELFLVTDDGTFIANMLTGETFDSVWICDKVFEIVETINIEVVL